MAEDPETPIQDPETPTPDPGPTPEPEPTPAPARSAEDLQADLDAKQAELDAAQEQINALSFVPVTDEQVQEGLAEVQQTVRDLQKETATHRAELDESHRENRRLKLAGEFPDIAAHLHLITSDDLPEMRKQAESLRKFAAERVAASRPDLEKEIAERFGPVLGTTVTRPSLTAEQRKAREEAIDRGDSSEVADQIVEANIDNLLPA